jgi:hypothetical protein
MKVGSCLFSLLLAFATTTALAGPVRDFEEAFRDAYADYRAALFMTNSKDAAASAKALTTFQQKWSAIAARWGASAPPQYADDPSWPQVLAEVKRILNEAHAAVQAGKLAEAHEVLEAFRDLFGALNARNNVATFSDRMNAYHAKMEEVLLGDYGGFNEEGRLRLAKDIAVLDHLAGDLARNGPAQAKDSMEFKSLLGALRASIAAVQAELGSGTATAMKQALTGLKPAYSRFFLKFG